MPYTLFGFILGCSTLALGYLIGDDKSIRKEMETKTGCEYVEDYHKVMFMKCPDNTIKVFKINE